MVAERSVRSQANVHENYKNIFAKFGDLNIQTGSTMVDQHLPWYLGSAFPFTLPSAVGGYDVPHKPRWRRPEDEDLPVPQAIFENWLTGGQSIKEKKPGIHSYVGPACKVQLFDITRGLPQRIEGQYRRHWGFTPALWNLYFRERINLGASLSVKRGLDASSPGSSIDTDAATAAQDLVWKLENGYYLDKGKRRKINGDFSKLQFAEKLSKLQQRLLADFRFRCKAIPGTQEIRTKIGHLGFWASVVYGTAHPLVVFPGYRSRDPFATKYPVNFSSPVTRPM